MHVSFKSVALALSLLGAVSASQASTRTQDLGVLGSTGLAFSNSFTSAQSFTDVYTFTLAAGGAGVTGRTLDTSYTALVSRDVQLYSIALVDLVTGTKLAIDTSPDQFTFGGLTAGSRYQLTLEGAALAGAMLFEGRTSGNYSGTVQSVASVASSAPEASDMAMSALGLMGVGLMLRRRGKRA